MPEFTPMRSFQGSSVLISTAVDINLVVTQRQSRRFEERLFYDLSNSTARGVESGDWEMQYKSAI